MCNPWARATRRRLLDHIRTRPHDQLCDASQEVADGRPLRTMGSQTCPTQVMCLARASFRRVFRSCSPVRPLVLTAWQLGQRAII